MKQAVFFFKVHLCFVNKVYEFIYQQILDSKIICLSLIIMPSIFILAIITLNNKWLNQDTSYMLSGILSFLFVVGLIFMITSIF